MDCTPLIPQWLAHVLRKPSFHRKLLVKPSLMSWRWIRYNDVKQPLALTDKDRLNGAQEPQSVPDGKYWALQMEFTLPTSTYATMALREVLRCDTSSAHQSTLNQEWGLVTVDNLLSMVDSLEIPTCFRSCCNETIQIKWLRAQFSNAFSVKTVKNCSAVFCWNQTCCSCFRGY